MTQGLELRGAVLGKGYRLARRLESSDSTAQDVVHEATHERIPGRFIIRLFPPESLANPESSSRIQRGARVASLLRDPHAVQVLDCNASGEMPAFVVLERVSGLSLAELMAEDGMLPLARVVKMVESLAAALTAGHQIGLVHGDLRPAHVIVPSSGQVVAKLSGFGWAKELRAAARVPSPSGYLAPEQDFGKVLTLDERVDQFGLAALTYEMIAACLPFTEESADLADLLGRRRTPPAIAELVPGISPAVDDVLRQGLAFTPSDRFASVLEFAARLRQAALQEVSWEAEPTDSSPATADAVADVDAGDSEVSLVGSSNDVAPRPDITGGPPAGTGTIPDDARTQIVRSPFFEGTGAAKDLDDEPDLLPASAPPATTTVTPRKGLPIGRPPTPIGLISAGNRPPGVNSNQKTTPGMGPQLALSHLPAGTGRLTELLRRKWTVPALTGTGLLLLIGAMIWIARAGDDQPARGAAIPVLPPPPAPAPTTPPLPPPAAEAEPPASAETAPAPTAPTDGPPPPSSATPDDQPAPAHSARPIVRRPAAPKSPSARANEPAATPKAATSRAAPKAATPKAATDIGATTCAIRISSKPWAEIWIDGKNTGQKTPVDNLKVACGTRKLELRRPDKDIEQMEMLKVVPGKLYRGAYELE